MFLFLTIAIVCLLITIAPYIVKLLKISKLLCATAKYTELEDQLTQARAQLESIKNAPASGEYAQLIKSMRAERKIKDVEDKIRAQRNMELIKGASVELVTTYALKAFFSLVLIVLTVRNRYTPVAVFDERFNLRPLEGLLSFPTGVPNAISVPVWVFSCNITFHFITNLIKDRK